ncbi:glycerophosphodiester phosphodiesterase family protein [Chitinophaga vietnamensis]|uniref:glycerophosphodiester phosphodiesterase family protein n=1 Tax=Chitinophaga vietnamensis TaxID=2593957 RepID=UPI001177FA9C|nr:glycerophosphodiester phosphodiesterase family protein [Chitinophaga vietnamensis]
MKQFIFLFAGLAFMKTALFAQQMDVQAHRGGMGLMPENTIPAMINAVKLGARTLELDCIITADNKVVVSHDPYMSSEFMRQPDGRDIPKAEERNFILYKMTYDSIRKYDAGTKPHPRFPQQQKMPAYRPLLASLIDSVEAYVKQRKLKPVYYNIETKSDPAGDGVINPTPEVFVSLVMGVINDKKIAGRVTVQSFDIRTLQLIHKQFPHQQLSLLTSGKDSFENEIKRLGFVPDVYSPFHGSVTPELVKAAHDKHVAVLPWTVDEETDIKRLSACGVDGIISNYPDRLVNIFGSYQNK